MKGTLEGPGGSVMGTELHFDSDPSKVEGVYWYGLVLIKDKLDGRFGVEDGLKFNSQTYFQF